MYKLNIDRKGLLYAAEIEKGSDMVGGYTEVDIVVQHEKSSLFLRNSLLRDPESKKILFIESVKGAESGLDHAEIIVTDGTRRIKHKIISEEIEKATAN